MTLSERKLRKIVKEEINRVLSEGWEDETDNRRAVGSKDTGPAVTDRDAYDISRQFSSAFNKLDTLLYDKNNQHYVKPSSELQRMKSKILPVAKEVINGAESALRDVKRVDDDHYQTEEIHGMLEKIIDKTTDLAGSLKDEFGGDPHEAARAVRASHQHYDEMSGPEYYK